MHKSPKRRMDRPFEEFASCPRKVVHRKNASIFQNGHPHCYTVASTICGTVVKQNGPRDPFSVFWEVEVGLEHIEDWGAHFVRESVLSVSVMLSVSLESAMQYRMRVDDVLCGVSLSGTMQSASFCTHRFVVDCGKPRGRNLFVAHALGCQFVNGE